MSNLKKIDNHIIQELRDRIAHLEGELGAKEQLCESQRIMIKRLVDENEAAKETKRQHRIATLALNQLGSELVEKSVEFYLAKAELDMDK